MKKIIINGDNYIGHWNKTRTACRGIIIKDGKMLLSWESGIDIWQIPGGGIEEGETDAACCIREVAEETGVLIEPQECIAEVVEYYTDWKWVNRYYICKVVGEVDRELTDREKEVHLVAKWLPVKEALELFGSYETFRESALMKCNILYREYSALSSKEWT